MGPVEESAADGIRTGLAVMSLEEGTVTVDLELLTPDAETLGTTTLTLPGHGHVARFIDELVWPSKPDLSQMEGILRATASGRVAALILQSRVGQFATLPVVPLEGP